MTVLATDKLARLRACELVLSEHLEEWVNVGIALTKIRDGRLYEAELDDDGNKIYEDFTAYMAGAIGQFDMSRRHAYRLIEGARIRKLLPRVTDRSHDEPSVWTYNQVCVGLSRLPNDAKIKQVANRAIKRVTSNGVSLGTAVRECVEDEGFTIKERKRKKKKAPTFDRFLRDRTAEFVKLADAIKEVDDDYLREFAADNSITTKYLKAAMTRLLDEFDRIWTHLPD